MKRKIIRKKKRERNVCVRYACRTFVLELKRVKLPSLSPRIRRRMLWNNGVRNEPLPICLCYYVQTINDVITTYVHGWLETRWCRTLTAVPFDPFHMFVVFVDQYIAWNGKAKEKICQYSVSTLNGKYYRRKHDQNDETNTYLRVTEN